MKNYKNFINENEDNNYFVVRNINIFNNQTETNVYQSGNESLFKNKIISNNWKWEDFLNYQKINFIQK
jgi:hypothetical protein